ncbi:MAG: RNA polymerase sigma factor [Bacteroidales bacterium]|nr:RNA polymerase sigma factor [Bacteroidales bacterium]
MSDYERKCTEEEKLLVEACLKSDRKAQKQLYDTYARRMMPICIRYTNDTDSAHDLLHDGFVKVFTHLQDFKFEGSFDGWMRRIFVNTALEQLRKTAERPYMVDVEEARSLTDSDYSVMDTMSAEEIMQCIQRLPAVYRTAFNMYAVDGYSHKEIAAAMGITESSSRVYLLRARQMLQEMIKKYRK